MSDDSPRSLSSSSLGDYRSEVIDESAYDYLSVNRDLQFPSDIEREQTTTKLEIDSLKFNNWNLIKENENNKKRIGELEKEIGDLKDIVKKLVNTKPNVETSEKTSGVDVNPKSVDLAVNNERELPGSIQESESDLTAFNPSSISAAIQIKFGDQEVQMEKVRDDIERLGRIFKDISGDYMEQKSSLKNIQTYVDILKRKETENSERLTMLSRNQQENFEDVQMIINRLNSGEFGEIKQRSSSCAKNSRCTEFFLIAIAYLLDLTIH
ncbi:Oidioi.mRNA.OKI2018_I69.PAR.g11904.t1.cds [Oikopleura dioica]|uniref:Oidioi.mRNA.OKI2018_I69.PAR.g11904.t1.cds n=1 Tax=Oikopleura dioica TaxID=34765 RepID=A0ABN7RXW1_OIKDI|nr:Oidioi.mRNA.OKI2018_I69.PAR.g11904.t1.cds [Oikopleura dioica]